MRMKFFKYQATGNDFILIDNRKNLFDVTNRQLIKRICDRKFGIGSDGLILLNESKGYDFQMVYCNPDGKESTMCGNGGRCITAFAHYLGIIKKKALFLAIDGEHQAIVVTSHYSDKNWSEIKSPSATPKQSDEHEVPITSGFREIVISLKMQNVKNIQIFPDYCMLNTGSPHYVKFVKNVKNLDVFNEARKIRYSAKFKKHGINVNFVEIKGNKLFVRTYERGNEYETLSCGTGIVASVVSASAKNLLGINNFCNVRTLGGELQVKFKKKSVYTDIWLTGPVNFVFEGYVEI